MSLPQERNQKRMRVSLRSVPERLELLELELTRCDSQLLSTFASLSHVEESLQKVRRMLSDLTSIIASSPSKTDSTK
jgi:hypothetical protein